MTDKNKIIDHSDKTVLLSETKIQAHHTRQHSALIPDNDQETTQIYGTGSLLKNRFDLLEIIGSGGMGTVYKSLDRRDIEAGNSSFIAIKVINDEYKNDSDLLKALHSEARKTQILAHPNIITVYDFDRDEDTVFITMEFIDGVPLAKVIKANPDGMPASKALDIISKMAEALIYAHSKNIIHLDFKPNNVLIDLKNQVKVLDFGIARLINPTLSRGFDASVLGGLTPSYASLEMFNNKAPDPRDDLYALACVSYELLSGHHPFNKVSAEMAHAKQLKPKKIKSLNSKQWNTLKQALAFNREDRIKDVNTFLLGLTPENKKYFPFIALSIAIFFIATATLVFKFSQFELPINQTTTATPPLAKKPVLADTPKIIKQPGNINIWTKKNSYQLGENLQLSFTVDRPLYIKIVIINSEGKLATLFPNPYQTENYCKTDTTYQIPPKNADFNLDIGAPKGQDKIIIVGSSSPIPDQALTFNSVGKILDPTLRQSLIHKTISYTIK